MLRGSLEKRGGWMDGGQFVNQEVQRMSKLPAKRRGKEEDLRRHSWMSMLPRFKEYSRENVTGHILFEP